MKYAIPRHYPANFCNLPVCYITVSETLRKQHTIFIKNTDAIFSLCLCISINPREALAIINHDSPSLRPPNLHKTLARNPSSGRISETLFSTV